MADDDRHNNNKQLHVEPGNDGGERGRETPVDEDEALLVCP